MDSAYQRGVAIGAFNVLHLETVEALVAAAEQARLPLILQISENCAHYHRGLEPIALATLAVARASSAEVAVHLDHAQNEDLVYQAVELGFGSVMYDGAHLEFDENVSITARVTKYAHAHGVYVEAELGAVGGKDGAHSPGVRTDPSEAAAFVKATGVDALAVAVGSSHAMTERVASVDCTLIARLRAALDVPLVLHGSSGVADENIVKAIQSGMTKINVSTQLNKHFTEAIRDYLAANPAVVDSRKYGAAGRAAVVEEAARLVRLFAV
jgi:fructose-bisphosphate aldolase class II